MLAQVPAPTEHEADEITRLRLLTQTLRMTAFLLMREVNPEQAWFWTEDWQAGEREADQDIAAGRTTFHESTDDFLAALDARRAAQAGA